MPDIIEKTRPAPAGPDLKTDTKPKVEKPKLYKVILLNDDYTPFELVVHVLQSEFNVGKDKAIQIMMTAHQKGSCVVAVYTRDVAETKVDRARVIAAKHEAPLNFAVEPEE